MMNQQPRLDLVAQNTQVTTIVAQNYLITSTSPIARVVKLLIQPPIEAICSTSHTAFQRQIVVSFLKGAQPPKFGILPNLRHLLRKVRRFASQTPHRIAWQRSRPCRALRSAAGSEFVLVSLPSTCSHARFAVARAAHESSPS